MEITGKIIAVLPANSGVSARTGNPWKSQEYVLETHDSYPRKVCFRIFGEDKINQMAIQSGEELTVSFDIDAHEYNGRWFNSINAWQVNRNAPTAPQPAATTPDPYATTAPFPPAQEPAAEGSKDDLPF